MNQQELKEISSRHQVNNKSGQKVIMAFISGGLVSILGQIILDFLILYFSKDNATILTTLFFIFIASILTGFGVFDKISKYAGAGLFIPITGFSNALTSSALECKREGLIYGIGSNMFKLAGSVITYGIVSAIMLAFIAYWVPFL